MLLLFFFYGIPGHFEESSFELSVDVLSRDFNLLCGFQLMRLHRQVLKRQVSSMCICICS